MKFLLSKFLVTVLAICDASIMGAHAATCSGGITPAQMITNIKQLTTKSQALQTPAKSITIVNGPLIAVGLGPFPQIILGFGDIVSTATAAMGQMQGSSPVTNTADATAIFNAFREFVAVHQQLLNILIGKAGLFSAVPLIGKPIAAVLRQIEAIVDVAAYNIINLVQSRAEDLQNQANSLHDTVETTIKVYQGLDVPAKRDVTGGPAAVPRLLRV